MLGMIDFHWVNRPSREIQHRWPVRCDNSVNLFNGAGCGNTCAGAQLGPEHTEQKIAFVDKQPVDGSCGRTPVSGMACVSHLTGSSTIPSSAACNPFHSLITSVAIWRSSGMSEGEAIRTRYVVAENNNDLLLVSWPTATSRPPK